MRIVEITDPHQRRHFEFFHSMNHPHFSVTANVEIGAWLDMARQHGLKTNPAIVYLLARAANEIPQLRQRIRDGQIVEHDTVHPTFTVATDVSEAFSFCYVDFSPELKGRDGTTTSSCPRFRGFLSRPSNTRCSTIRTTAYRESAGENFSRVKGGR